MKQSFLILILALVSSCSTLTSQQEQLKRDYVSGNYEDAKKLVNSKEFKVKENKLLYLMELSSIYHFERRYLKSLETLREAQTLADKLYTKSVRELILSGFVGDDAKSFYGKVYERSALYHMQIINMYKLFSGEKYIVSEKDKDEERIIPESDRKKYLLQARSVVLAWNSFYQTLQRESQNNFFSYDYYQKILSALIHEEVGSANDINTAFILYENTLKDFDKLISIYPSLNSEYSKAFETYLAGKKIKNIKYTSAAINLKEFLKFKLLLITKNKRKYKFKSLLKKLKPSKQTLEKIEKPGKNITVISSKDFVDVMKTKVIAYNLNWLLNKIENPTTRALVEGIGVTTLTYFTLGTLGFSSYHSYSNRTYVHSNFSAGNELIKNIGVEVKVPYLPVPKPVLERNYVLKSSESEALKFTMSVLNSFEDKLYTSTRQYADKYYNTLGPKIALKYLTAILAAYSTNQMLKKNENPFANALTLAQFLVSTKAISATQSVDTRHWVGLNKQQYFENLTLKAGKYKVIESSKEETDTGTRINVTSGGPALFFL